MRSQERATEPGLLLLEVLRGDLVEEGPELPDLLLVRTAAGGRAPVIIVLDLEAGLVEDRFGREDRDLPQARGERDGVRRTRGDRVRLTVLQELELRVDCLLYTSPSPRDGLLSRM